MFASIYGSAASAESFHWLTSARNLSAAWQGFEA